MKASNDEPMINQPVVIDNGSGVMKAGFAGDDTPTLTFSSVVGRPKHQKLMIGALDGDFFVGSRAQEHRGLLSLKHPMSRGIVEDWEDMELVWSYTFSELKVDSEEHPALLTEAPLNPSKNREKMCEIFFDTFNSPAVFVSAQAILSLYSGGRTTGVVLDSGDGLTHVMPVCDGYVAKHAITRSDIAGRDVTSYLMVLLRKAGYLFHTTAETDIVRMIKERACYVAFNPYSSNYLKKELSSTISSLSVELPDGTALQIGSERFKAPEILFNTRLTGSEYPGLHELLTIAICRADMDLRKSLYSSIILSGGSTMFPGLADRLLNEIHKLSPRGMKIRIMAPNERRFSAWIGGSILGALTSFKKMWISKQEYEEEGSANIHRRSL